ncbi:AzlD domain-containing protein [uncultured Eubacterium sp.]|uniref:branched-chain amino acid transporter permease n=1 Tax=uncultured Eubacterium sp. TaxID=165185 RepID=UPI0025E9C6E4|nr:AzlD domain-containing protein [uncultured Eubacterium sp.]
MLSTSQMLITVLVAGAVTFATRLIPFAAFGKREVPKIVKYLGDIMPSAIIGILIIYCIKDGYTFDVNTLAPQLIAIALTVIVHLWKRNTLISISVGTVSYMLLIHYIFI